MQINNAYDLIESVSLCVRRALVTKKLHDVKMYVYDSYNNNVIGDITGVILDDEDNIRFITKTSEE